jgi:hypothetical protein
MKTKNTLVELLQHQLKLAEAGESFEDKFEFHSRYSGEWIKVSESCIDFMDGDDWRIVDQDQHLLDRSWIRHTGDVCPVHRYDEGEVILKGVKGAVIMQYPSQFSWRQHTSNPITHYRVTKKYVEEKFTLDGIRLNKPYVEAPPLGTEVWYAVGDLVYCWQWSDHPLEEPLLRGFNCWKTGRDALSFAKVREAMTKKALGAKP